MREVNRKPFLATTKTISRAKAVILILLFLGPLLGSFVWYYGLNAKLIPGQINNAPLVSPPVALDDFENPGHDEVAVTLASLRRKWTIVHIVHGRCNEECETLLYNTRQVRLATGRDAHRIARMILAAEPHLLAWIRQEHPDAALIKPAENGIEVQLNPIVEALGERAVHALLIDPLGNVMMTIPSDLSPQLLLKDLKKLLKLSRIG